MDQTCINPFSTCGSMCQAKSNAKLAVYYPDEHQRPTDTTQHDQFVGYDNSNSSDDDVNMTQENIDIEACWKIFAFPMHVRSPAVERLYFHLENQQHVYWTDDQQIGEVLSKNTIK
ncbi:hypothetical protein JHK85_006759 [Glycine max]|nr:hypothetical protein JHK85_006759 [Glycine max]